MTDWTKPIEINLYGGWMPAKCIYRLRGGMNVVVYEHDGEERVNCFTSESIHVRNVPTPPTYRAWKSREEMGEAINHWFTVKGNQYWYRIISTSESAFDFYELFSKRVHSPTPWLPDSWLPCGVKVEE